MGLFSKRQRESRKRKEKPLGITRKYNLALGKSYVVEESPPDMSFDVFVNLTSTEEPGGVRPSGLVVSRRHKDLIQQKYGLEDARVYWLATRVGEGVIAPTNLGILTHTLVKFVEETPYGVVLLDGIEYLVSNNDFVKVLRMLDQVNDQVSQSTSRVILPVDPRAFDQKELALLERSVEKISKTARPKE